MAIHRIMGHGLCALTVGMCGLMFSSVAFADDCQRIGSNPSWKSGMAKLSEQTNQKQWNDALKTAENLSAICDRMPVLNYVMGRIYKEKGNDSKALYYYQRATLFTEEFAVNGKQLEQMWFDRYEAEHPDARPEAIEAMKNENAELKERLKKTQDKAVDARFGEQADLMVEKSRYGAGLWTGVAVAGIGLVLTGVGAGLIVANSDDTIEFEKETVKDAEGHETYYIKPQTKGQNNAYWGMLGAGIAATVVGVTLTGIFGYWYSHTSVEVDDSPISFYGTPNGIGIRF